MKKRGVLIALFFLVTCSAAIATEGLVQVKSPYSAAETLDRLEEIVKQGGFTVFARIDHAAGAAKAGKSLRPTAVLIFGNPKGGTALMECAPSVGIDLPLKALAWEDAAGQVWLGYNNPAYLAQRHGISDCPPVAKMSSAIAALIQAAVAE
jgi:uncharacterized protein (DUF302 family)